MWDEKDVDRHASDYPNFLLLRAAFADRSRWQYTQYTSAFLMLSLEKYQWKEMTSKFIYILYFDFYRWTW